MIAKIKRGQRLGGLMVYLLGEGDANEHEHRHLIAGSPTVLREAWMVDFHGPEAKRAARDVALEIAREIDLPRKLYNTPVRMKAKPAAVGAQGRGADVIERPAKGETGVMRDAPVWHCILAAMPGEHLTDEVWAQITGTFMTEMGFTATADAKRAQARWGAVRHGLSGEHGDGQDHVHIAASLVREDGSKVNTYDYGPGKAKGDWSRAKEVCALIEQQYGLKVHASRTEGGELSGHSRAEVERAKRERAPETERDRLRRMVRSEAVAADSEAAFVRGLREAGISVVPRWAAGGQTEVVGYKVRLRHGNSEAGPWLGGGTLAKDLNLNALREQQWDDTAEARAAAVATWMSPKTETRERAARGLDEAELWQQAATEFGAWHRQLGQIPRTDRARWAWAAGQAAGVFAAWSEKLEGEQPGPLAAAAQELTRSAQLPKGERRYRPASMEKGIGDVAKLLMSGGPSRAGLSGSPHARGTVDLTAATAAALAALLLLLLAAIAIALEIARAHRERGELARAVAVQGVVTAHLEPTRHTWETQVGQRRQHEHTRTQSAPTVEPVAEPVRSAKETRAPKSWLDSDRMRKAAAAAAGPLTPPSAKPTAARERRVFYTDMTAEQRSTARLIADHHARMEATNDPAVRARMLSDRVLAAELAERRAEIEALARELERRRTEGGDRVRQAKLDNIELARRAELIEPALEAEREAAALTGTERQLLARRTQLRGQLDNTARHKMIARQKLSRDLGETEDELKLTSPHAEASRAAAKTAAESTGTPRHAWEETIREADTRRQKNRLDDAADTDAREFSEDHGYLSHLQREYKRLDAEQTRRAALTPQQRDAEQLSRNKGQEPGKKSTKKPGQSSQKPTPPARDYNYGITPPQFGQDRDSGLGL